MVFSCKILINQYAKIFYVSLLVEGDKLISVIIKYLEDAFVIKSLRILLKMKDYRIGLFDI